MLKFKQIISIMAKLKEQKNVRHLSWLKRFLQRVLTMIINELESDCPQKISDGYQALNTAVAHEDEVYLVSQKSDLTPVIEEWDSKRDNTYVGIRTMAEALSRIGTDAQKAAASRVLDRCTQHRIDVNDRYEDEGEKIAQLCQDLQGALASDVETLGLTAQVAQLKQENDQTEHYLELRQQERAAVTPQAMKQARLASDEAYEELTAVINAYAVTEWDAGTGSSPFDTAIDTINSDIDYYEKHVFNKTVKSYKLGITVAGAGSAEVTDEDFNTIAPDSEVDQNAVVCIAVTPVEGKAATAKLNDKAVELTKAEGADQYTGQFKMPGKASTLIIDTAAEAPQPEPE